MLLYRERLHVPISWWVTGAVCVFILGTTLAAGLSVVIGIAIYLVMGGLLAIGFATWGSATVRVTDRELSAGSARLSIDQVSDVSALDQAQTTALRGPNADVSAFMLVRPYLAQSVYVAVAGRPANRPYLLIGTRRPADLAAVIAAAMPGAAASEAGRSEAGRSEAGRSEAGRAAAPKAACDDDDPDDHAAVMDGAEPVDAAHQRKDGNAW